MLGIIFFIHMGLLRSPRIICQNTRRFVGSDKVIPTFGDDGVISRSTCMGSRPGLRVVKVMRPNLMRACFDVIRPADGRYNQLTQQRRDGREGGVSKGELMELDQWECLGLVT